MKQIIRSEHLVKSYGQGTERRNVLNDVSVSIADGEFVSIMGPSGSGKSTLLFAMSGMDSIDSGAVFFDGQNLADFTEPELADLRRTQMGFVFQQPTMLKYLSIRDNILLPAVSGNRKSTAELTKRADLLMKKMGIAELGRRDITQVSGGQLQRAGICRALMASPNMIFGDEPTGALNSKSADEIMNILAGINADGTTVLLVTHDAKVAARTERILFMRDGKLIDELRLSAYGDKSRENRISRITAKMQEIGI